MKATVALLIAFLGFANPALAKSDGGPTWQPFEVTYLVKQCRPDPEPMVYEKDGVRLIICTSRAETGIAMLHACHLGRKECTSFGPNQWPARGFQKKALATTPT